MKKIVTLLFASLTLSTLAWGTWQVQLKLTKAPTEMKEKDAGETETKKPTPQNASSVQLAAAACSNTYYIGYATGFENDTLFQSPQCWESGLVNTMGFGSAAQVENYDPYSGLKHVVLFNEFGDTTMLISPQFGDLTLGQKQIRFMASTTDTSSTLVIGSMPNQSNLSAFQAFDTIHFTETSQYREYIIPVTAANGYNMQDSHLAFLHGNQSTFTTLFIDEVEYDTIPPCQKVTNPFLVSIGDTSVGINFNDNAGNFRFYWGPRGYTQGTITITGDSLLSTAPATIHPLQANTEYELYIFRDCGNALSDSSLAFYFSTACNPFQAPYFNDFENEALHDEPACWTPSLVGNGGNRTEVKSYNNGSSAFSGSQHLEFFLSGSNNANHRTMLISPAFSDLNLADKQIRFMAAATGGDASFLIGTVDNPLNPGSFQQLDSIFIPSSSPTRDFPSYSEFITEISSSNGYNGTDSYIAIVLSKSSASYGNIYIDDFHYELVPACSPPSFNSISLNAITTNSADLNWTPGMGIHSQIKWGPAGFDPNTAGDSINDNSGSYRISNLSSNTAYEVYLRDSCTNGSYTYWLGPLSFSTACTEITAPYLENFDGANWAMGNGFDNAGDTIDNCWWRSPVNGGQYRWTVGNGPSPGFGTGPDQDVSGSGNYIYSHGSYGFSGDSAILESPRIDVSALSQPFLSFAVHRFGPNMPALAVLIDSSGTWREITRISGSPQNSSAAPFQNIGIDISSYPDTTQIRFVIVSNGPNSGDCSIDELSIDEAPTCPDPVGLAAALQNDSTANLSWSAVGAAGSYEIWFGPQGFYQGTNTTGGTKTTTSNAQKLLDSLSANTYYEFVVRGICGPGDSSNWVGPQRFKTPCTSFSAPYLEDFENFNIGSTPDCYEALLSAAGSIEVTGNQSSSGSQSVQIYNDFFPSDLILVSPNFNDMDLGDKRIRFKARNSSAPSEDLIVGTISNPSDINSFQALDTIHLNTNFNTYTLSFDASTGYNMTDKNFAFKHGVLNSFEPIYIDELHYELIPSCAEPTNLSLVSSTATSADVSWNGTTGQYEYEYGIKGFSIGSGTRVSTSATTATVSLQAANVPNQVFVRSICAPGDTSLWAGPIDISVSPILCDDFEAYNLGSFDGQSTLFESLSINDVTEISSLQANSGTQSMRVIAFGLDASSTGVPFNAIDSGRIEVSMAVYVPMGSSGFINFFKDYQNSNLAFSLDFFGGTANVLAPNGFGPPNTLATFNYSTGVWFDVDQIIDFDLDTCYIKINGQDQNIGWSYSQNAFLPPAQLTGLSFVAPGNFGGSNEFFIDDFCITELQDNNCTSPFFNQVAFASCDSVVLEFGDLGDTLLVEYGLSGFNPGSGTLISGTDSLVILDQLLAKHAYEVYYQNICNGTDSSDWEGPISFQTDSVPLPNAAFTYSIVDSLGMQWIFVDASGSSQSDQYQWNFGNGQQDTGLMANSSYSQNGPVDVQLVVSNACGSDTLVQSFTVNIGLAQFHIESLSMYPNPVESVLNIEVPSEMRGKIRVQLFNSSGQEVWNESLIQNDPILKLPLQSLPQGMYHIRLEGGQQLRQGTLVKH